MSSKSVLTIIPGNVVIETVDADLENPIIERQPYSWKKGSLGTTLEVIDQVADIDQCRVLISDHFCHITGFEVEKKHSDDRNYIKNIAQEFIPEDLNVVKWDYSEISTVENKTRIQVFALTQVFNLELEKVSNSIKSKLVLIIPISLSILESIAEKDESFLVMYSDDIGGVIVCIKDGLARFSTNFTKDNISKKILEVMSYMSKYLEFIPEKVVVTDSISTQIISEFKKNFKVVAASISASANIADISRLTGSDKKVLSVSFSEKKGSLSILEDDLLLADVETSNSKQVFFLVLIIMASLGLGLGYLVVSLLLTSS